MDIKETLGNVKRIPEFIETGIKTLAQNQYYLKLIDFLDSIEGDQGIIIRNSLGLGSLVILLFIGLTPVFSSIGGFMHIEDLEEALITLQQGEAEYESLKSSSSASASAILVADKRQAEMQFGRIISAMGAPPETLQVKNVSSAKLEKGVMKTSVNISLKKVSIKHVSEFINSVESTMPGINFDDLKILTSGKSDGWMSADFTFSFKRSS